MKQGYIKLHRQIQDSWLWVDDEPFDRRSAWIDILMSANHAENKLLFDGSLILIERGSFITSIRKLSARWKWSTTKVCHFLDTLEGDNMIARKSDSKKTLISVINYGFYQDECSEKKTVKKQQNDTEVTLKKLNKNDKECTKNEKNISSAFTPPTVEEVSAFITENNFNVDAENFLDYYRSNGWMVGRSKMKDWKATVRRWHRTNGVKRKYKSLMEQDNTRELNQLRTIEEMYLKGDIR